MLNEMSKSEEGMNVVKQLIAQFQKKAGMFKEGGKLNYFIKKYKGGGKEDGQRSSDRSVKEFHGIDIFPYTNSADRSRHGSVNRKPHPNGTNSQTLPNGVGLRQITRNNITTTELVSPDKKDTLYVHDGVAGRVDSNIDDSGVLGMLGLKKPTPVSSRYAYLQNIFDNTEFKRGGVIKADGGEKIEDPREMDDREEITHNDGVKTRTEEHPWGIRQIFIRPNGDRTERDITFDRDTTFRSYPVIGKGLVLNRGILQFDPNELDSDARRAYYNTDRLMKSWGETLNKYFPSKYWWLTPNDI